MTVTLQTKSCNDQCDKTEDKVSCYSSDMSWYSSNVVSAFNQRVITAAHIGEWKKQRGKPIFDPTRVEALLNAIAKWNQGPLEDKAIKDFFNLVINRTTLYEEEALDHPPKFTCSFFYDCSHGYETECKETCSIDDKDLTCWRDDINVYTKSLLVSINQMAILEARLAEALKAEGLPPVDDAAVVLRIDAAERVNKGPLPDPYVVDIFRRIYRHTRDYSKSAASASAPEFACEVSPSCRSAASRRSHSFSALIVICLTRWLTPK